MIPWRRKWQPTPVLLPGEPHGQGDLVDYSPWGRKRVRHSEWLTFSLLIDWWWRNRVVLQDSWAQPELPPYTWAPALVPAQEPKVMCIITQSYSYLYRLGRTALSLQYCPLVTPPLFLHSFTSLIATIWICSLVLREGLWGWSLFPTHKKWETQKGFVCRRAPQSPARFHLEKEKQALLSWQKRSHFA